MRRRERYQEDFDWDADATDLPAESELTHPRRSALKIWITLFSIVSSLGLLALVLLIALYPLNVGTIWSSQRQAAPTAGRSTAPERFLSVRNGTNGPVTIYFRDRSGAESLIGTILALRASKLRMTTQCLNGNLVARSGPVDISTSARLCAGDTWIIRSSG